MKPKLDLKSIVCGALLGAALVFAIGAATGPTRTVWEYRIVDSYVEGDAKKLEAELNSAGNEGWEAVSCTRAISSPPHFTVLFKRRKD